MSLLPEAGGEGIALDARSATQGINPESPPPALVCRNAQVGVPAYSVS